jgi:DNA polymerase-3 subunit alpha
MRDILRRYKPDTVEDLTALNALYRPGPHGGMIDDFIERKWGRARSNTCCRSSSHPQETLGVIVYQEQVMQIANVLASYSLGEADLLRRAMGKKDPGDGQAARPLYGAARLRSAIPRPPWCEIFDQMEKFAGYGFNKSHSAAYALLAYQTAYLKTHYPVEFMAALLTSEISKPENVVKYIQECREMGIAVEPPDVQVSGAQFTPQRRRHPLRPGRGQERRRQRHRVDPEGARELEEKGSTFKTFWEFCEKVDCAC